MAVLNIPLVLYSVKLFNFVFPPLEIDSRNRDPQLQVDKNIYICLISEQKFTILIDWTSPFWTKTVIWYDKIYW